MGPIRYIFPTFVLAMWVICGVGVAAGTWTTFHWGLLGLAFLGCTAIFVNFVYVFSYGYGISMVLVNGAVMALRPSAATLVIGGLGLAYGLRLTWFVHARYRRMGFGRSRTGEVQQADTVPLPLRLFMWVSCSWLMTFVSMPAVVAGMEGELSAGLAAAGLLMLAGLGLETVADEQKQAGKARSPGTFVSGGLYARLRHPNYLGEIIFQAGLILATLVAAPSGWYVALGSAGPLYIVILMYYAAHDQDNQQARRYGADAAYVAYRDRSGSLLPRL